MVQFYRGLEINKFVNKVALIIIFQLTMDEMAINNVKGVAHNEEPTEPSPNSAVPLSSTEPFNVFHLIV